MQPEPRGPRIPLPLQLVLCAATGSLLFGFSVSLLNTSIVTVSREFDWCHDGGFASDCHAAIWRKSVAITAVFVGAAVGAISGGPLLRWGRRPVLLGCMGVAFMGTVSTMVSTSLASLVWARIITGLPVGASSVVCPAMMAEVTPKDRRGAYGVIHTLAITGGQFLIVLMGLPLPPTDDEELYLFDKIWWRAMAGMALVPVLIAIPLLLFVYTSETPHYYVEQGYISKAKSTLRRLHNKTDIERELLEIITATNSRVELPFREAFRRHRRVLWVGCMIAALQQFVGINAFMASSNKLFKEAGLQSRNVTYASLGLTLLNFLMTVPAMYLIEMWGRRLLLLVGCIGMCLCTVPGAVGLAINGEADWATWVATCGAVGFIICFAGSYGPTMWVYLSEIFPAEVRGLGTGLATAVCWVASTAMVLISGLLDTKWNFIIFTTCSGAGAALVSAFALETRGLPLGQTPYN